MCVSYERVNLHLPTSDAHSASFMPPSAGVKDPGSITRSISSDAQPAMTVSRSAPPLAAATCFRRRARYRARIDNPVTSPAPAPAPTPTPAPVLVMTAARAAPFLDAAPSSELLLLPRRADSSGGVARHGSWARVISSFAHVDILAPVPVPSPLLEDRGVPLRYPMHAEAVRLRRQPSPVSVSPPLPPSLCPGHGELLRSDVVVVAIVVVVRASVPRGACAEWTWH